MRVAINAHLISLSEGYRNAGVGQYLYHLVTNLQAAAPVERILAYVGPGARAAALPQRPGLDYRPTTLPTERPLVRIVWEQTLQPLLLLRDRIDILHCPVNVAPIPTTVPTVLTVHDLSFLRFPDMFSTAKQRYLVAMTAWSAQRARVVMTDSEHTRRDVIRLLHVPPERVRTVYPGLSSAFHPFAQAQIAEFKRTHALDRPYIVHVGTLQPRKNLVRLIEAFAAFRRSTGAAHELVLVGSKGWQYERLLDRAHEPDVSGHVRMVGFATANEIPLWYAAADAMAYPSLYEGFGFPLLEAMACGTPVLTSTASCLPEVAGDAALFFGPSDVPAMALALQRITTDQEVRDRLRERGLVRAAQFTWQRTAQEVLASYALAGKGR